MDAQITDMREGNAAWLVVCVNAVSSILSRRACAHEEKAPHQLGGQVIGWIHPLTSNGYVPHVGGGICQYRVIHRMLS